MSTRPGLAARTGGVSVAALVIVTGAGACRVDDDRPAPFVAAPAAPSACGTTAELLPKLSAFVADGGSAPLAAIVETRFRADTPRPGQPTVRTLLDALLALLRALGVERTRAVVGLASTSRALDELTPLVVLLAEVVEGKKDGQPRWSAVADAGTLFVRCDGDALSTSLERLLRFPAPDAPAERWFSRLLDDLLALVEDPGVAPFVAGFERSGQRGRPAIASLLVQLVGFVVEDDFAVGRVRALLESVVYPAVGDGVRAKIERLLTRVEQVARPEVGVLAPLQVALRCLMGEVAARDALAGLVVDLLLQPELGVRGLASRVGALVSADERRELADFAADLLASMTREGDARDELFRAIAVVLAEPDVRAVVPVIREGFEAGVVTELIRAFGALLAGCGRGDGGVR